MLYFNLFLIFTLFFWGLHLLVEERNYLNGFYPESYENAGFFYNLWTLVCSSISVLTGLYCRKLYPVRAVVLIVLSVAVLGFSVFLFFKGSIIRLEAVLPWTGNYIILAMLLNFFMCLQNYPENAATYK